MLFLTPPTPAQSGLVFAVYTVYCIYQGMVCYWFRSSFFPIVTLQPLSSSVLLIATHVLSTSDPCFYVQRGSPAAVMFVDYCTFSFLILTLFGWFCRVLLFQMCLGGWLLLLFINFCTLFSIIGKGIKFVEFSFFFLCVGIERVLPCNY